MEITRHEEALARQRKELLGEKEAAMEDVKASLEQSHKAALEEMKNKLEMRLEQQEKIISNEKQVSKD